MAWGPVGASGQSGREAKVRPVGWVATLIPRQEAAVWVLLCALVGGRRQAGELS